MKRTGVTLLPRHLLLIFDSGSPRRTSLSYAAGKGNLEVVERLSALESVKVSARDMIGRTALHWAALEGHVATVEHLLDCKDIEPDEFDIFGRILVSYAIL